MLSLTKALEQLVEFLRSVPINYEFSTFINICSYKVMCLPEIRGDFVYKCKKNWPTQYYVNKSIFNSNFLFSYVWQLLGYYTYIQCVCKCMYVCVLLGHYTYIVCVCVCVLHKIFS